MFPTSSKYFFSKLIVLILFLAINVGQLKSQSTNCSTASQISLATGSICVNGTSANSVSDNILYGACNAAPVNIVWYTYIANGSNNTYSITPGTLTNAQIVIYTGGCPNTGALQTCTTATGSNSLTSTWGMAAGTQVWVGIASNGGNSGTFQLCVKSIPPAVGVGNTCSQAIPICSMASFTNASVPSNSSGQTPGCFLSAPQQDVWLKFTISQAGSLCWKAIPNNASTSASEFDWALWDITAGCPGTLTCCNYNYAGGSSSGFGMQNISGTVACNSGAFTNNPAKEFSPQANVTCGRTYAIQISNYDNDNVGFSFSFANSTCVIGTTASFVATPTLICGPSLTATITNSSIGTCQQVWDYGDGSATYTGGSPPAHTYTTPGTYAIKAQTTGACTSIATQFVKLLAPLAGTITSSNNLCAGACTGSASVVQITGGDGVYTYAWTPGGSTGNSISGLCAGNYSVSLANATCSTTITKTLTITTPPALTLTTNAFNPSCGASNGSITASSLGGTPGYSFSINNGSYSSVSTFTNLASGSYTISLKDASACTTNTIVTLAPSSIPTITVNSFSICAGQSNTLIANGGTSYTWSPATGLSSTSGSVVVASPTINTTYNVVGSIGSCTNSAVSSITVVANPTISVSSQTTCSGTSATLTASGAATYTWSNASTLSSANGTSVIATPLASTVYTIIGSASTCTSSTTASVTISSGLILSVTPSSATICPGASTTLTASGASTYTWTNAVTLSSANGTSVNATPSSTQTYTVNGSNANGCVGSTTVTIVVASTPTVLTSANLTVCPGATSTISATGANTYTWNPGASLNTVNGSSVIATPSINTTYTVTGSNVNGCIGSATISIVVASTPTILTSANLTVCPGTASTISATGANTYTWSPGASLNTVNGSSVIATPSVNTTYSVNGSNINGCIGSATISIAVASTPTILTSANLTVCPGTASTISATGANTYTWSPGASLNTVNGSSVIATPSINTTYTVTGSNANGCIGSATISIAVASTPTILTSANLTVCPGTTSTISATGANTYTWSPGASLNTANGSSVIATPSINTTYTITGTNTSGCISSATISITMGGSLTVNVSPNATVCPSTAHTFSASGAPNYTWTPNIFLNTNTSGTVICTPTITTTYTIDGSNGSCSGSNTVTIIVSNTVVVTASATSPTICPLGNTALNASGATNYTWTPSLTLNSPNGGTVTATPPSSQTYTIVGATGTCTNSAQVAVTVTTTPVITVATSPTICSGSSAPLNASGANTYTWSPAAGITPTVGANVAANPNSTTTYTVAGSAQGCSSFTTVTVSIVQVPMLSITANPSSICAGKSSTLSVFGANTYTWSPAASLNTPNGATVVASPAVNTTYNVFGSNTLGTVSCNSNTIITVNVIPNTVVTISKNDTICLNDNAMITASGGNTFSWSPTTGLSSPNSAATVAQPLISTIYTITASNGGLCPGTNTVLVYVRPLPTVYAGRDTTINIDETYVLHGTGNVPVGFLSPDGVPLICNYCPIVEVHPLETTCYTLEAEDQYGCKKYDDICITITKNWDVFIPNAFTPNGDLDNEYFMPKGFGLAQINMSIFDRWGVEIFQENDTKLGWDGKYKGAICQQGVYIYQIETVSMGGVKFKKTGHVNLLVKAK
jgi:gliding motility-associated-like protein